ncbi:hypothetical protein VTJ49DRAFT_3722 [Mycothermus thermophilus]|uniref:Vacuolar protein-sorting-associated protein 25 n=1 Tax=Humicola insolens TaxID=85995 RepID=A0ABR3VM23_HUMIN
MTTPPPAPPSATADPPSSSTSNTFTFPPEYFFPPFFTRQTNLTTHHAQLIKWSSLVLAYCRHHRILKLSLSGTTGITINPNAGDLPPLSSLDTNPTALPSQTLSSTTGGTGTGTEKDTTDLFHNRTINRRLSPADIREVIDFLRRDGRAEYVGGSPPPPPPRSGELSTGTSGYAWIYWRSPEEWAALVEAWVDSTGQKGSVLTLYELIEGDGSRGTGELLLSLASVVWQDGLRLTDLTHRVPRLGPGAPAQSAASAGETGQGSCVWERGLFGRQVLLTRVML